MERSAKWGTQHKNETVKESEMVKREDVESEDRHDSCAEVKAL